MEMDIWRSTTINASVDNLHYVLWDPRSSISTLWDAYISVCASTYCWKFKGPSKTSTIWDKKKYRLPGKLEV
jgi:hypothetical protein